MTPFFCLLKTEQLSEILDIVVSSLKRLINIARRLLFYKLSELKSIVVCCGRAAIHLKKC